MVATRRLFAIIPVLLTSAGCPEAHPCRAQIGAPLCQSTIPLVDAGASGAIYTVEAVPNRVTLWVEDPAADGGGWLVDLPQEKTVFQGGHSYRLAAIASKFGTGTDGFYGSSEVTVDGAPGILHFDAVGTLAGVGDPLDGGRGYAAAYRYDALLTRRWCSSGALRSPEQLARDCRTCGAATYRHYQVIRSGDVGSATYLFVADEPPRGCGSGVDLVQMEFPGG